jgi:hypothetical protein
MIEAMGYTLIQHPTLGWIDQGRATAYETVRPTAGYLTVRHKDGDRGNCALANLRIYHMGGYPPVCVDDVQIDEEDAHLLGLPYWVYVATSGVISRTDRYEGVRTTTRLAELVLLRAGRYGGTAQWVRYLDGNPRNVRRSNLVAGSRLSPAVAARICSRRFSLPRNGGESPHVIRRRFVAEVMAFAERRAKELNDG